MSHDAFAIPVLTYHSMRVDGNDYASNDHVALREDLKMLDRLGWVVRPLDVLVVEVFESPSCKPNNPKSIAIAFDDGSDFDAKALKHPTYGTQQSMLSILQDFASSSGQQTVHATSFVIVSPDARKELEGTCMAGLPWWNDDWWGAAIQTGLMSIGNHSWDHNHDTLKHRASGTAGGNFFEIEDFEKAESQVRQAAQYVSRQPFAELNRSSALFAYPYGHVNDYLSKTYLPEHGARIGVNAAFACGGRPWTASDTRWSIPRFVCGYDWKSPSDLTSLLNDCAQ